MDNNENPDNKSTSTTNESGQVLGVDDSYYLNVETVARDKLVGSGMYGTVWLGSYQEQRLDSDVLDPTITDLGTPLTTDPSCVCYQVAIKELNMTAQNSLSPSQRTKLLHDFQREAKVLNSLHHRNIVHFFGVMESPRAVSIVTEFLHGGTLYDLIQEKPFCLTNYNILKIATDIARGMNYLHSKKMLHRDLKSQNVMLDSSGVCKVVDFGFSRVQSYQQTMTRFRGTPVYMANEAFLTSQYDHRVDVFSFGILLWELCSGVFPWSTGPLETVIGIQEVLNCVSVWKLQLPIVEEMREKHGIFVPLIEKCRNYASSERPTFSDVLIELNKIALVLGPRLGFDPETFQLSNPTSVHLEKGMYLEYFEKEGTPPVVKKIPPQESPYLPKALFKHMSAQLARSPTEPSPSTLKRAEKFFKDHFNLMEGSSHAPVPIDQFFPAYLTDAYKTLKHSEPELISQLKPQITKSNIYLLCWVMMERRRESKFKPTGNDAVSVESLSNFYECWGKFGISLVNCVATFSRRFYYGFISWSETLKILKGHPTGSFILRSSRKHPQKIGIAFIRLKNDVQDYTQVLVNLEDVMPGWEAYIAQQPMLASPIKFPKHDFFPPIFNHLHKHVESTFK